MTSPLPNMLAALVDVRNGKGYIIDPWNSFFQQFTQQAPASVGITGTSPLTYTANVKGNLLVIGGTISNISLIRGSTTFNLTGQTIIPISIGDTVVITFSVTPTIAFLGS